MRKSFQRVLTILLFVVPVLTKGETALYGAEASQLVNGARHVITSDYSGIPAFILFEESRQPEFSSPELWLRMNFGMSREYGLKQLSAEPDQIGYMHYRYQQTFNGYPVDATMWIVHVKNSRVVSMNGLLFPHLKAAAQPRISETDALAKALSRVGATQYKWQIAEEETHLKVTSGDPAATYFPKAVLSYSADSKKLNFVYSLAYRFDIYAHEPMTRQYVFVDAVNGTITDVQDRIWEVNRTGTAATAYAGTQTIITDSTSGSYRLRESNRGAGLGVETYDLQRGTSYGAAIDFTDADNFWNNVNANKDQYATDCHFASEKTYDYYYLTYGRNSINNAGLKLLSYVHYSTNYVNAFWDGSRMTYGDGNATYNPLTSLDIGGHEITHGLTQYTANLVYSYQSGALNESFSDCFGTAIEWYADPAHADWLIGEDIGAAFRSHSNPNAYGDPDTYTGTNWYTGSGDNGGVHTNSGVQNFWFYLLANGGSGTNDLGNAYSVSGIGITKAAAIAFRNLTVYLTSSSQYSDARNYAIQAATDLYGPCSPEVISTTNAWYAVGVGASGSGGAATVTASGNTTICNGATLTLNASSVAGAAYQWSRNGSIISGATSTSYVANQAGSYTVTTTGCGSTTYTSNAVTVTVIAMSAGISPSGSASGCSSVLLTASGTSGYGYQWKLNGVNISGATSSTYTATQSGNYTVTLQAASYPQQNFNTSTVVNIPDNTCTNPAISNLTVSGYNGPVNSSGITCTINLTHTYDGDINFMLEAPNGDVIGLSDFAGGSGDNFTNTIFSDAGAITVANGTAPFTGTYKPWQALISSCTNSNKIGFAAIGNGLINPNGTWRLRVYDRWGQDIGTINSFSMTFPSYTVPTPNCGPVTSAATAVTIGGGITVNAGTYSPVCANSSPVALSGTPSGGTFSGTGVSGNTFNPNVGAGTYPVTYSYTDGSGCSGSNTTNITVNPIPNVSGGTYPDVCDNAPLVTLSGVPAGGTWSGTGVSGNNFNPATGAGTYILTYSYTAANGCSNSATSVQKVNGSPVVNAGSYSGVCDKSANVSLTGTPAGGSWSGTGVSGSTFVTASVPPGTYPVTYSYTASNGCANSASTNIVVNSLPVVSATNVSGCAGSSIALTGSPAGGSWSVPNPYTGTSTTYTYSYTDGNGCTNTSPAASITVNPLPSVSFSGLSSSYDVSTSSAALTGSPAGGTFSGPGVTGNAFSPSAAGVGGPYTIIYSYTDANGCSNTSSQQTNVTSCTAPTQPGSISAAGGNTKVCPGDTKTYSIGAVSGASSYTWTLPAGATFVSGQGTTSVTVNYTSGFTTSGTLSVVASSACGTSTARTLTITRNTPATPSVISGAATAACAGSSGTYSVTNVSGMVYNWSAPANAIVTSGQGTNSVTISFSASFTSGSLTVRATNGCGQSNARTLSISSKPSTPGVISGASQACPGTNGTYSVTNVSGVTYNWITPANATVTAGQGTNSVTVNFSASFSSGSLTVTGNNACGASAVRSLSLTSVPSMPGSITGTVNNLCNVQGVPYSIPSTSGATGYNWTVPAGATIATNNGTSITVNYGTFTSGQVCVTATNACGNSALRCVTVSGRPATPSTITGPATVCANQAGIGFSCATQPGATYTWLVPSGASIVSGQGTGSITVNWGTVAGTVRVTPSNACGNATARTKSVTINCRELAEANAVSGFTLVPNPATDHVLCNFKSGKTGTIEIRLVDLTGREVGNTSYAVSIGANQVELNISGLSKGVYLVKLASGQQQEVKRLVVQ